jgi:hypothetical protein
LIDKSDRKTHHLFFDDNASKCLDVRNLSTKKEM